MQHDDAGQRRQSRLMAKLSTIHIGCTVVISKTLSEGVEAAQSGHQELLEDVFPTVQ